MGITRSVRIVETILARDTGQEVNILPELIKMSGFSVYPIIVDGKTTRESFIEGFMGGRERYVHVSAHGNSDGFYIHGQRETHIGIEHLSEQIGLDSMCGQDPLRGRFLTVSACGHPSLSFWREFHECTGASAVVAPMGKVGFAESAMFYASFYFALLRHPHGTAGQRTSQRLVDFIDAFQRTKTAYLSLGGYGGYRLCFWWEGEFKEVI